VGDDDGVHIPHTSLKPEVLRAVIEEFVTREGTDYGDGDVTLDDKVKAVIAQLKAGQLDLIIVTANAPLDWDALIAALGPKGRLHIVGAVLEPIPVQAFPLILGQKEVSGSPTGSPTAIARMLDFCARHSIEPMVEMFPMSRVNEALDRLREGKVRYRAVLKNDFAD
jgi:uncharacterized zinc-type alcohol dehydrogenase-like protein